MGARHSVGLGGEKTTELLDDVFLTQMGVSRQHLLGLVTSDPHDLLRA